MTAEGHSVALAFLFTLLAGLSTGIGSALAFFSKRTNRSFLSLALGFSAGVMIYVSFVELFAKSREFLSLDLGGVQGPWLAAAAFFGGMIFVMLIDNFIPSPEDSHQLHDPSELNSGASGNRRLTRTGLVAALAVAAHNLPEGLATFFAAFKSPALGADIALAIAIHNIPEGIAVSVPIYYATGSRKKAFVFSFLSGLAEPLGALIGYGLLSRFMSDVLLGVLFAGVAGIMVFIAIDELLPAAREHGEYHKAIYGVIAGMAVIAVSLLPLR